MYNITPCHLKNSANNFFCDKLARRAGVFCNFDAKVADLFCKFVKKDDRRFKKNGMFVC